MDVKKRLRLMGGSALFSFSLATAVSIKPIDNWWVFASVVGLILMLFWAAKDTLDDAKAESDRRAFLRGSASKAQDVVE